MNILTHLKNSGLTGNAVKVLINNGFNMEVLRTNAILRKDEWVDFDERAVQLAQEKMTVATDLIDMGLTYELPGGLGDTVSEWETEGDRAGANISMEMESNVDRDLINYESASVPIPIISADFKINMRTMAATTYRGSRIDLSNGSAAARKVGIKSENLVVRGWGNTAVGKGIYGLTNHPYRSLINFTTPFTVSTAARMILDMIQEADDKGFYGPFTLYFPTGLSTILYEIMPDTNGKMLMEHLQQIDLIKDIKVTSALRPGEFTLLQTTDDVIDLAVAQPLITVEWDSPGGFETNFKVFTAFAPRLKYRQDRTLGVVHATFPLAPQ